MFETSEKNVNARCNKSRIVAQPCENAGNTAPRRTMRALNLLIKEWTSFLQEALDIVVLSDVDCLRFGLEVFLLAFLFCRVMSC